MNHKKKNFKKLYEDIVKSDWFKKAYHNKSLGEFPFIIDELEESEDERILNAITRVVLNSNIIRMGEFSKCDMLNWLEKEKKRKKNGK